MKDKVICGIPNPNKKPTRIDKWKFDLIHNAIFEILSSEVNRILFKDLPNLVKEKISIEKLEKICNNPRNRNLPTTVYCVLNPTN